MKYTDDQLINRVESHAEGFTGWKKGVYLVAVRSNADVLDAFDDKAYLFVCAADGQRPDFKQVATCTTNAGSEGLKKFDSKYGLPGCAVLKANQIVYNSHTLGKHKGQYNAYIQTKGFPYSRDKDRDNKAETSPPWQSDVIKANVHRASATKTSTINFNWSIACVVMNNPNEFDAFMAFMAGRPLSLCLLQEF